MWVKFAQLFTSVFSTMAAINSRRHRNIQYGAEWEESLETRYFVRSLTFKARLYTRSCNVKEEQKNQSSTTEKCMELWALPNATVTFRYYTHHDGVVIGCSTGVQNLTGSACTWRRCLKAASTQARTGVRRVSRGITCNHIFVNGIYINYIIVGTHILLNEANMPLMLNSTPSLYYSYVKYKP
jgi:hypothetical protein